MVPADICEHEPPSNVAVESTYPWIESVHVDAHDPTSDAPDDCQRAVGEPGGPAVDPRMGPIPATAPASVPIRESADSKSAKIVRLIWRICIEALRPNELDSDRTH